jgi:hypothetical protein
VLDFLVREGFVGVAEVFQKKTQQAEISDEVKEHFRTVHSLISQVSRGSMEEAQQWLSEHSESLKRLDSTIEFTLHKLNFLSLFRPEAPNEAMVYIRQHINTSDPTHLKDLSKLLTVALYPDAEHSPYSSSQATLKDQLEAEFIKESCRLVALPTTSHLLTVVQAAAATLPGLTHLAKVTSGHVWKKPQIDLLKADPELSFHSIFVCPVSREISTPENHAMLLPCGHILSANSFERLVKSNHRAIVKCPTCPVTCGESEASPLHY